MDHELNGAPNIGESIIKRILFLEIIFKRVAAQIAAQKISVDG